MANGLTTTNGDDRVPPLLRLSTELLDRIISLSVPPAPKLARRRLATLLSVHPTLVPIVRRALYRKVSLIVGDPRKSDRRLLDLLEGGGNGTGPASEHVQYLRIRLPDPPQSILLHPGQDPAFALLPRPHLDPVETLKFVARVVNLVLHVRHIELNLHVGLDLEGEQDMRAGDGNESAAAAGKETPAGVRAEAMRRLEEGLKRWAPRLETCISAVEDPKQRLQVWADASDQEGSLLLSPHIRALASWHNLSRLDLWRVRLVLPRAVLALASEQSSSTAPTFRLAELVLTQCQLGGAAELEWLLGSTTAPFPRSSRLNKLVLDCVEFDETPGSSAPIRAVFEAGNVAAHLPFSTTLECLTLILPHPIVQTSAAAKEQSLDLFSSLTALRAVELGGPGITEPILVSLFGAPDPLPRSGAPTPPPSSGIRELLLGYLISIRFSRLLSYLNPSSAKLASISSFATHPLRDLESLTFKTTWDLPREWTWEQRQRTREPLWNEVHYNGAQLAWRDEIVDDGDTGVAGWDHVEDAVKQLVRERTKLAIRSGAITSDRAPLRLFKNRLEYTYDYDDSDADSDGDASGTAGRATRSGSEMDPNALFEPSDSGDNDEDHNAWVRRRIEEEEDYESDF